MKTSIAPAPLLAGLLRARARALPLALSAALLSPLASAQTPGPASQGSIGTTPPSGTAPAPTTPRSEAAAPAQAAPATSAPAPAAPAPAAAAPAPAPAPERAPRQSRPDMLRAAESFREAIALYRAGSLELAIFAIDSGLGVNPSDLQLRFLKGVILSEQGRRNEARRVFEALTQEFPEAPEPHNNLAVIYAGIGELDLARNSLEAALRAAPDYAVARENLGDVYLRLAAREFERASKNPSQAASATRRMELTRDLINRLAAPEPSVPAPRGTGSNGSSSSGSSSERSSGTNR